MEYIKQKKAKLINLNLNLNFKLFIFIFLMFNLSIDELKAGVAYGNVNAEKENIYYANTFTHNQPRQVFNSTNYPWRVFGKLVNSTSSRTGCTAQIIGESLILTNRHCILDDYGDVLLREHQFYYNIQHSDIYSSSSVGAYPVKWGVSNLSRSDWALLELSVPIGKEYGYLGISNNDESYDGSMGTKYSENKVWEMDLCSNTSNPLNFLKTYSEVQNSNDWLIDYRTDTPKVCLGGYPGDLGDFNFTLSNQCSILGEREFGYWMHDCPTSRGSSGSALFYKEKGINKYYIVALSSGAGRPESKSLINVPFGAYASNGAVRTDKFYEHALYIKNKDKNQIYFNFMKESYSNKLISSKLYKENNEADSFCGKTAINSLMDNNVISEDGVLRTDIANMVDSKKIFEHPSKNNYFVSGYLVIYEKDPFDVYVGLVNPFNYLDYEELTFISKSDNEGNCLIEEADIIDFINDL